MHKDKAQKNPKVILKGYCICTSAQAPCVPFRGINSLLESRAGSLKQNQQETWSMSSEAMR